MEYISVKEAAALWGIDPSRIGKLLREGRVEGAKIVGRNWLIPKAASKPADGRRRKGEGDGGGYFRFPLYVNRAEEDFSPPLNREEKILRDGQVAFYACEFERAKEKLSFLCEHARSIYIKIAALFYMCIVPAAYDATIPWKPYFYKFNTLLSDDFPHKKEMELFVPWLDYYLGLYKTASGKLSYDPEYGYHSSCNALIGFLSICNSFRFGVLRTERELVVYELLCKQYEESENWCEAQELHRYLFVVYLTVHDKQRMLYHTKRVFAIAKEHNLLYAAADWVLYYADIFEEIRGASENAFCQKIYDCGNGIYRNFVSFTKRNNISVLYSDLSRSEYRYMLYASQNYTNRQIAKIMNVSEHTVANHLSVIYEKLGISGKQEIAELMKNEL